jgi:hypothetical protein
VLENQNLSFAVRESDWIFVDDWIEPAAEMSCTDKILHDLESLKVDHIKTVHLPRSVGVNWIGLSGMAASILKRIASRRYRDYLRVANKYGNHKFGGLSDLDVENSINKIQESIGGAGVIRVSRLTSEAISISPDDT